MKIKSFFNGELLFECRQLDPSDAQFAAFLDRYEAARGPFRAGRSNLRFFAVPDEGVANALHLSMSEYGRECTYLSECFCDGEAVLVIETRFASPVRKDRVLMKTSNGSRNTLCNVALVTVGALVVAWLTWFAYRCGVDNTSVALTVGSGIAMGWFAGGSRDVNSGCQLFVGWLIMLLAGSAMAFSSAGVLPAVALFAGGLLALFTTSAVVNS